MVGKFAYTEKNGMRTKNGKVSHNWYLFSYLFYV